MNSTPHSRILPVLLAALVLIGGANLAAYAANGKPLLLGKTSVETKKSTVKNTGKGPALHLKTRPGEPPLKVNRTKKVNKLNADLIDGANASDLESLGYRYELASTAAAPSHEISFPGLPPGVYLMTYTITSVNGGSPYCFTEGSRQALSYASDIGASYDTNVASALVDTTSGPDTLLCVGSAGLSLYSSPGDALSEVSFVRLDHVTAGTPTATRPTSPRGGPATSR